MQIGFYIIYLVISFSITAIVGRHLHKHGYFLILDLFGNENFTKAVNSFLLMGYYLINLGYVALTIKGLSGISRFQSGIELLSEKLGFILLILGYMHIANIIGLQLMSSKKEKIMKIFNQ